MTTIARETTPVAELLPLDQAAEILRVSRSTMWRLRRDGKLPDIRLGREQGVYVRRSDVAALVDWDQLGIEEAADVAARLRTTPR